MTFLREYWLWIAIPFALVLGSVLLFLWLTDGEAVTPFVYGVL